MQTFPSSCTPAPRSKPQTNADARRLRLRLSQLGRALASPVRESPWLFEPQTNADARRLRLRHSELWRALAKPLRVCLWFITMSVFLQCEAILHQLTTPNIVIPNLLKNCRILTSDFVFPPSVFDRSHGKASAKYRCFLINSLNLKSSSGPTLSLYWTTLAVILFTQSFNSLTSPNLLASTKSSIIRYRGKSISPFFACPFLFISKNSDHVKCIIIIDDAILERLNSKLVSLSSSSFFRSSSVLLTLFHCNTNPIIGAATPHKAISDVITHSEISRWTINLSCTFTNSSYRFSY